MDKYDILQELFHNELNEAVTKGELDPVTTEKIRKKFMAVCTRINYIEATNFIEFAKSHGLLPKE
jgi:hypothetical protein